MKAYAQKQSQPGQKESIRPSLLTQHTVAHQAVTTAPHENAKERTAEPRTLELTTFAHDFSRIPVYSKSPLSLQPKLTVNKPRDIYEQEADHMAAQVANSTEAHRHPISAVGARPSEATTAQSSHAQPQAKNYQIASTTENMIPSNLDKVVYSAGQPLDSATRAFMGQRFGHDFRRVRIHADTHADSVARSFNAHALTVGQSILFRQGLYDPRSERGKKLLAHELMHTIQQERMLDGPRLQRQVDDDAETDLLEESEPDEESKDDVAEHDEETEPEEEKPKTTVRRKHPHRPHLFSGKLTNIFGGKRGIYLRNWSWSWGKVKTQRDPPRHTERQEVLHASDDPDPVSAGDSEITAHGAAFYNGEKLAADTVELTNFERSTAISVEEPKPALKTNETSHTISVNKTVTGTLKYKLGDEGDPSSGPRARVVVEKYDPATGEWTIIHDTTLITTGGKWQTDSLDAELTPDAAYRVRVFAEYWKLTSSPGYQWGDGRTQVDYILELKEDVTKTVAITKTTLGKSKVIKRARKFRLRL